MEINKLLEGRKYYYSLLFSFLIVLFIFFIIKVFFFNSVLKENKQLVEDKIKLEKEYTEHINNKKKLSKNIKNIKSNYNNASDSYYLLEEIDSFYSNLSLLSKKNNLKIKKVDKKVLELQNPNNKKNNSKNLLKTFEIYYTVQGKFSDYLKLREDLANKNKVIIYKEEIVSKDSLLRNSVIINATLNVPAVEKLNKDD